ncbi:MAG: cyclase family protein [Cyclobacteriaceae bacterium]|nr:cyclase family protein [Cyclobacteriaceae bacterium]
MKALISVANNRKIEVDLNKPIVISIPIKEGDNPNCYWAEPVKFETIKTDGFIGSVAQGGSVNYQKLQITPHGNGTHIECYGHITNSETTINNQLSSYHFYCKLISLSPQKMPNGDLIIGLNANLAQQNFDSVKAVIIRTLPNTKKKLTQKYSGTNPPFLDPKLVDFLVTKGIEHLLIDLPSIDKEVDGGTLLSHRVFWNLPQNPRKNATITELIYIPETLPDNNYLLNLQTINLAMDAAPCNPVLYKIEHNITIT